MIKINEIRSANGRRTPRKTRTFKVVLLGEILVGKSCLVNRLVKDQFRNLQNTIGAAYCTHTLQIDNAPVKLEIWDTAGQERFHSLVPMYYRHTHAAIVVYDITNRVTFENAKKWTLKLENQVPGILKVLVGNKVDLISSRCVQMDEARAFADENYLLYVETSAKTNVNVTEIFRMIAEQLVKTEMPPPNPTRQFRRLGQSENTAARKNCCN